MRCDEFEHILEQEHNDPYTEDVAAHLDACDSCRRLAVELSAIRMAGHSLGEQDAEEMEVPEHVWTALHRQLQEEGLLREPAPQDYSRASWWTVFRRPAFAGAALFLLAIAGFLAGSQNSISPQFAAHLKRAEAPAASFVAGDATAGNITAASFPDELQSDLNETVEGLPRQDAVLVNSLRRDMDLIDSSIAMCEKSVREQPGNEIAREYLYGAYQQKAELLDAAMNRTITGGLQ